MGLPRDLDIVEISCDFLDIVDGDLPVLHHQQVLEGFFRQIHGDGEFMEAGVRHDPFEGPFQFAHVGAHLFGNEECSVLA